MVPVQAWALGSGCLGEARGCKHAPSGSARPWPEWAERYLESHFVNLNLGSSSESMCVNTVGYPFLMQKALKILTEGLVSLLEFKVKLLIKSLMSMLLPAVRKISGSIQWHLSSIISTLIMTKTRRNLGGEA